ncbi:MAG: hypothetical protein ACI4JJ_01505 [Huintestinicola sp.]
MDSSDNSIGGKISSLLSDEESMKQIKELADMLGSEINGSAESGPEGAENASAAENTADGSEQGSGEDLFGGLNFDMLMQIGSVLSAANGSDKNRALLLALKPHVSEGRQEKIDKAVKMLKVYAIITALRESGFFKGFDKML